MSDVLCRVAVLVGGISSSWNTFKLLKQREHINFKIQSSEDDEDALQWRVQAELLKNDFKTVLKFWSVFAFILLFDLYIEMFVFWIPFYYTIKFTVIMWIVGPQANGASILFDRVLAPNVSAQEYWIDYIAGPQIKNIAHYCLAGLGTTYVRTALSVADDLEFLEDELDRMKSFIEVERFRRMKNTEEKNTESKESKQGSSSGWFDGFTSWTENHEISSKPNVERRGSVEWIKNSFDAAKLLAGSTKEVILGQSTNTISESRVKESFAKESPAKEFLVKESYNSPYSPSYDQLSDIEDSDSPRSRQGETSYIEPMKEHAEEEDRILRSLPSDPYLTSRRRRPESASRPMTRSQKDHL